MGQNLCVKKVPFCKSGHIYIFRTLVSTDLNAVALDHSQVIDYLENADTMYKEYMNTVNANPPIQPKGGSVLIYDLGVDETQWEVKKKKLIKVSGII